MEKLNGVIITLQNKCSCVVSDISQKFGWKNDAVFSQKFEDLKINTEKNIDLIENNNFLFGKTADKIQKNICHTSTSNNPFFGLPKLDPPTKIINNQTEVNNLIRKPVFFNNSATINDINNKINNQNNQNNPQSIVNNSATKNLYDSTPQNNLKVGSNVKSWSENNANTIRKLVEQKTVNQKNSYFNNETLPAIMNAYRNTNIYNSKGYTPSSADNKNVTVNLNVAGNIIGNEEFTDKIMNETIFKLRKGGAL